MVELIAAIVLFVAGVGLLNSREWVWGAVALVAAAATLAPELFGALSTALGTILSTHGELFGALIVLVLSAYALRRIISL
jgi:hypothetical protein